MDDKSKGSGDEGGVGVEEDEEMELEGPTGTTGMIAFVIIGYYPDNYINNFLGPNLEDKSKESRAKNGKEVEGDKDKDNGIVMFI